MDVMAPALLGALTGAVLGGGVCLVAFRGRRRGQETPASPPGLLPAGATAVLSALRSASLVVDPGEAVLWASPSAHAWGLLRDGRLADDEVVRAVRGVLSTGEVRTFDLQPRRRRRGGPRLLLAVRAAPIDDGLVLVLVDDRSEAARVDDVRRDFVANVSHELKTPVGALSLLAEAVEGAADDPEAVNRFAARMQHEAARLASMVNDLIELSRLQDEHPEDAAAVVPVDEVVADALDSVRTSAQAKHIDLRAAGEHGLVVHGSREQLTTALRNLLDNAVNYSPDRTRVVVSSHAVADRVEISVADQGIGISAADQERVFERFYRVDPARSRATGGTGLGLSIVKHVTANHGGDVVLWSIEGAGSTFTLRLPVHGAAATDAPVTTDSPAATDSPPAPDGPDANAAAAALRKVVP
ncbi:MAG: sensor histidine kinase [Actinomycetes bacterium]